MPFKRTYVVSLLRVTHRATVEVEVEIPTRIDDMGREVESASVGNEMGNRRAALAKACETVPVDAWKPIPNGENTLVESNHVKTDESTRHHGPNRERVAYDHLEQA